MLLNTTSPAMRILCPEIKSIVFSSVSPWMFLRTSIFENSKIEVLKNIQGDTDENTMLLISGQRILIAGDVVFNNMHVYTAETDGKARERWLNSLKTIRELHPSIVVPGHSKVGAPLDASTAVDFTESYLLAFEKELTEAKDPDGLINAMKKRFPTADLLLALERGAMANVEPEQKELTIRSVFVAECDRPDQSPQDGCQ